MNNPYARAYLLGIQVAIDAYGVSVPPSRALSHLSLLRQIAENKYSIHDPEAILPESDEARLALRQINLDVIRSDCEIAKLIISQIDTTYNNDNPCKEST